MKTAKIPLTVLASLLLFFPAMTRANPAVEAWVQRYNGPGNGDDYANAVAVDSSNNVVVTGYSTGAGGYYYHYATIKYSSVGVPLWTNRYDGPRNLYDEACAVAVDGSNNVVVTGYSTGTGGNYDYATIKYSSAGVPLWTNRYNGPENSDDYARAVAVDGSNNVIVTGYSYSSGGASSFNYVIIKYSSAGMPLWTNRYNGPGYSFSDDRAEAVAVDGDNNVIVTGFSLYDYATIKYSSAGVPLWTNRYAGPANSLDYAYAVAVDGDNNVIVTGSCSDGGDADDYTTVKYSSAGVPLWTNRYDGPASFYDDACAVKVDSDNNVIVTGTSDGSYFGYATIKYSSAGVPLWTNRYNGLLDADAYAVAVDSDNNVIVTGTSSSSGGDTYDYATVAYSSVGMPLWTNRYNGPGNSYDYAMAMAVDHSNNVIVTGSSYGIGGNYDYATIKYSSAGVPLLSITRTAANTVIVSWPAPAEGWVLEYTNTLMGVSGAWPQMPPPYQTNETTIWATFTNMPATDSQFYRLQKPSGWGPFVGAF
jgi:uncharacterized delta-60 repeat protein